MAQRHVLGATHRSAPTAEVSHPHIPESRRRCPSLHLFAAELRVVAAAGKRADISDTYDVRTLEQRHEPFDGERAVSNGCQRRHRHETNVWRAMKNLQGATGRVAA